MNAPASLHPVEYFTIAAYLVLMGAVGWVFKRFNRNVGDYFRSGNRGTWWLVGSSAFMSSFSAWTFTGAAGVAYEAGWSAAVIFLANSAGFLVSFLWTAPWFRQLRATTAPEVIRLRFGPATQQFYALFNVLSGVLHAGLHLLGLAIFCSGVFGFPVESVILFTGLVVLVCATAGGNWGAMATDFLQGMILLPITLLVAWLSLRAIGGWDGLAHAVSAQELGDQFALAKDPLKTAAGAFTWGWISAMTIKTVMTINTLSAATKFFAVKDGRDARKAALLCSVLMLLGSVVWFLPPMVARLLYAGQVDAMPLGKPAESAYAVASLNLLPPGLVGLVVVAMFAATMSSMDTGLNRNAAILVKDIYPALCRRLGRVPLPDERLLRASRVISALFGVLIIALALYYSRREGAGVFEIMIMIGAYLGTPMAVPMFIGLFVRRVPAWAAMASVGAGLLASLAAMAAPRMGGPELNFQTTVLLTFGTGTIAFFAARAGWSRAPHAYRKQVATFFNRMRTPVDFEREVGGASDLRQLVVLGGFSMMIGLLILGVMPFTGSAAGAAQAAAVAGFLLLGGGWMWRTGRKSQASSLPPPNLASAGNRQVHGNPGRDQQPSPSGQTGRQAPSGPLRNPR